MNEKVLSDNKRNVVHGLSPNPKKGFTEIRQKPDNAGFGHYDFDDDSFDFSALDFVDGVLAKCDVSAKKIGEICSGSFLNGLKSIDVHVKNVSVRPEELVVLTVTDKNVEMTLVLRGFWATTQIRIGEIVRIFVPISETEKTNFIFDSDEKFLLTKLDQLLTATTVSTSMFCHRRTVLNEKINICDTTNDAMLLGSLVHLLFQQAVRKGRYDLNDLKVASRALARSVEFMEQMYFTELTEETLLNRIDEYIPSISKLLSTKFRKNNVLVSSFGNNSFAFDEVVDIEENIWCTKYGFRGKIDLTAQVISDNGQRQIVAVELKTGRTTSSAEHKGQVMIYGAMLSSIYTSAAAETGLLIYLKEARVEQIQMRKREFHGLIQLRNSLATFFDEYGIDGETFNLPEPIESKRFCSSCPQALNCCIMSKLYEKKMNNNDGFRSEFVSSVLAKLNEEDFTYIKKWFRLICIESREKMKQKNVADVWNISASEREIKGHGFFDLRVSNVTQIPGGVEERFEMSLNRHNGNNQCLPQNVFAVGDYAILTNETKFHVAIVAGTISFVDENCVKVIADRLIRFNASDVFRLDHYGSLTTYLKSTLGNVTRLFADCNLKLKNLIVNNVAPQFNGKLTKDVVTVVTPFLKSLNKEQALAVLKVLRAEDYVLIKGLPHSGKTVTIVALIEIFLHWNKSILLTSSSHFVVDNILTRLNEKHSNVLRLGADSQVHPLCKKFTFAARLGDDCRLANVKEIYDNSIIVATTTSAVGTHPLFTKRRFDLTIVIGATLIQEPICLASLFCSNIFVLVDDSIQRSPSVSSKLCREEGMAQSLFARLESFQKDAVVHLTQQY